MLIDLDANDIESAIHTLRTVSRMLSDDDPHMSDKFGKSADRIRLKQVEATQAAINQILCSAPSDIDPS